MPKVQRRNFENYAVQDDSVPSPAENAEQSKKGTAPGETGQYGPGDENWAEGGTESASPTGGNSREQNNESYYEQSDGRTNQYGHPKRETLGASNKNGQQRPRGKTSS